MKGAIVFLAVFAIAVIITIGNTAIPPGKAIYDALLPNTEAASGYLVGGQVDAITLIIAVFNGVIYGFIAWLIFTIINAVFKKDKKQTVQQVVNVNISDKDKNATVK
ncbi:MAG: hypothetical protein WHU54_02615 [Candidatus Bathyarchaeia archaeon]|jgi:hypothetical protein